MWITFVYSYVKFENCDIPLELELETFDSSKHL